MAKWSKGSWLWNLNQVLNKNHNWFDYVDTLRGQFNMERQAARAGATIPEPDSYYDVENGISFGGFGKGISGMFEGLNGVFAQMPELINSLVAHYARTELTGAEREMNEFNAAEAQKSRDFTQFMAENKYSMETQSMMEAGVNPALVYGGGNLVPTAANGAAASGHLGNGGDFFGMLTTLMRLPAELAEIRAQADKAQKEGDAALINAGANAENAESNRQNADSNARNATSSERQAGAAERQAAVAESEVDIKRVLADNDTRMTDAQVSKIAADEAYVKEQMAYIPVYAEAEMKKANAAQSSAYAAIQNARAALQNAGTNAKMTDSQVLLNAVLRQKESVYRDYLPAQLSAQVDEMKARGYYWNQEGKLVDKQGRLVDAQTVRTYVEVGTDVARTACQVAGTIATGGLSGTNIPGTHVSKGVPTYSSSRPFKFSDLGPSLD